MKSGLYIVFLSMLPFIELRGSIPVGIAMGLPFWDVWLLSIIGNLIPILPILILFQPVSKVLLRFKWYQRIYNWLYARSVKKGSRKLNRNGALGLFLFTAIPLPTTGAWTAAFLASFFQIKLKYSFLAISLGVIFAGFIIAGISELVL